MRNLVWMIAITWYLTMPCAQGFESDWEKGATQKAMQYAREGMRFQQIGDFQNAIEQYRKSIGFNPKIKEVHYNLAKCCATTGMNDDAMSEFRTALNIDGNYVVCRNDYGMYLWQKLGKTSEGELEFKKCMQIDPKYPFPFYNYGIILRDKGDLEGAIDNFTTTTRLKPDFAEAWRDLGLAIFERASAGDLTEAVAALERSAQLAPENPKVHYHLGIIYATKGDLDRAEAEYRRALMCDARMAAAHWELARLRYLRGDLDRCLAEMAEAQKINPTYTRTRRYPDIQVLAIKSLKAQCLEYKGKLPEAIEAYQELARLRGNEGLYQKHVLDLQKRIKLQQKERRKKPLTYDSEEVDAYVSKGIEQYEDGQLDSARASFERALELNPQSVEALMNLSAAQEAQGDLNGAIASNQRATQACPEFDGAYYNLAFLLEKVNLRNDAAMMYEKFHQIAGKYPYDPQHIIDLQQDLIRQQRIDELKQKRGY